MATKISAPVHMYSGLEELYAFSQPQVQYGLESIGLAAQFWPGYTHRKLNLHSPAIVLLSFIVRGHCWHILGDNTYEENGGSLGITHYGQFHDIITDEHGADIMNLYLDLTRCALPHLPHDLLKVLPTILPLDPCFQNHFNQRTRLVFSHPNEVTMKLFAIERELVERRPGHLQAVMMYFKLFLIDCCRQALESGIIQDFRQGSTRDIRLEDVRRYLESNYAEPVSLARLAERAGVTSVYLCRAFKEYTGRTIFSYLLTRRIQEATVLLRSTDEKIATIAFQCGFNDLSYFNRKFKQMVCKSPGEYRACMPAMPQDIPLAGALLS